MYSFRFDPHEVYKSRCNAWLDVMINVARLVGPNEKYKEWTNRLWRQKQTEKECKDWLNGGANNA